jgi:hypothetical protein
MSLEIDRRRMIANLTGSVLTLSIFSGARASRSSEPRVDARRLQGTLEELSTFGRPTGGSFADGVSRVAYSDADVAGRAYAMGLMKDAGLAPAIDPAGNIVGRRAGLDPAARPIAEWRRSRRAVPGQTRAHGHDFRTEHRRHQSFTQRALPLVRLCERC